DPGSGAPDEPALGRLVEELDMLHRTCGLLGVLVTASPSSSRWEVDAKAPLFVNGARSRAEPPMSMPLAYPSTLDRRPRAGTSAGRRHRGGALEPEPHALTRNTQAKAHANAGAQFQRQAPRSLSLSGGASIRSRSFQAEHHLLIARGGRLQKRRSRH